LRRDAGEVTHTVQSHSEVAQDACTLSKLPPVLSIAPSAFMIKHLLTLTICNASVSGEKLRGIKRELPLARAEGSERLHLLVPQATSFPTVSKGGIGLPADIQNLIMAYLQTPEDKFRLIMRSPEYRQFNDQMMAIAASQGRPLTEKEALRRLWGLGSLSQTLEARGLAIIPMGYGGLSAETSARLESIGLKRELAGKVNTSLHRYSCNRAALAAVWVLKSSTILDLSGCKSLCSFLPRIRLNRRLVDL